MSAIIAIDAGFARTGWAVLCNGGHGANWKVMRSGSIPTEKSKKKKGLYAAHDDARRMMEASAILHDRALISKNSNRTGAVIELPHGGARSADALKKMAAASAMVVSVMSILRIPCEFYTPDETRIAGGGRKTASKAEIVSNMQIAFPEANISGVIPHKEAIADALATFLAAKNGNIIKMMEQEA